MIKEFYTINEVSTMTGFTTRSLRNYIQSGILNGEKIDGIWQFSPADFEAFISDPNVAPGIKTKNNYAVYDFLSEDDKKNNEICIIMDLKFSADEVSEFNDYICQAMNNCSAGKMKMEFKNGNLRAIISGPEDFVLDTVNGWYRK